jgi:2-polyprenyl-6-methoxyphenol hydroxylase-like FAD-dependent oxidoreductase
VGDAWVLTDPIAGQGANLGSHSAFVLAEEIIAGPPFDEAFCRRAEARLWEHAAPVVEWSNSYLLPPPAHRRQLLAAACDDSRVADAYINNINDPAAMWNALATPEAADAWLLSVRRQSRTVDR